MSVRSGNVASYFLITESTGLFIFSNSLSIADFSSEYLVNHLTDGYYDPCSICVLNWKNYGDWECSIIGSITLGMVTWDCISNIPWRSWQRRETRYCRTQRKHRFNITKRLDRWQCFIWAKNWFEAGLDAFRISTGDLDGDGKVDVARANINTNSISLFKNTSASGSASFDVIGKFLIICMILIKISNRILI